MSVKTLPQKTDSLTILKRRRITQKFWRSKKSDEIVFVTAPILFGKTVAVKDAMETLRCDCLYINFNVSMNEPLYFLTYMMNRVKNDRQRPPDKLNGSIGYLLNEITRVKMPEVIVIDDFHLCGSKETINAIKSLYTLCREETGFIIISCAEPPDELADLQCKGKIIKVTEEDLTFSENEVKKLAEQNRIWISNVHALELRRQSAGCAGYIAEKLLAGDFFDGLPEKFFLYTENISARYFAGETIKRLSGLRLLDKIPFAFAGDENAAEQIREFSHNTGLINVSPDYFNLHSLFKLYLDKIKPAGDENLRVIWKKLLDMKEYEGSLLYAITSQYHEAVEETLLCYLKEGVNITAPALKNLCGALKNLCGALNGVRNGEAAAFFIKLYNAAYGDNSKIEFLLKYYKKYPGIKAVLKGHVFVSPYPHENKQSGFFACGEEPYEALIKSGELCFKMDFAEALDILKNIRDSYNGGERAACFMLLINAFQGLYMYRQAENEMRLYREWAVKNHDCYAEFERFQTERLIIEGDIAAAMEWLCSCTERSMSETCRADIEYRVTDALAYIAAGEPDTALWQLKDAVSFAGRAGMFRLQTECFVLSALAYQRKQQLNKAVEYMEKALALAFKENQAAAIGMFGTDTAFLIEKCYCRAKRSSDNNPVIKKLLVHVKNNKMRAGFISAKNGSAALSERQMQVLNLLNKGFTYSQIAESTDLKITTVRDHIKKLYEKLEVRNSADAIVKAQEKGIL